MTPLLINTGSVPNDRSADSLYSAFNKVNANFTELYLVVGLGPASLPETIQDNAASLFTSGIHHGITVSYRDSHDRIDLTVLNQSWNQLLNKPTIPSDINQLTDITGILGGSIDSGDMPPVHPKDNGLWYDTIGGRLYVYYGNTWIDTNPESAGSGSIISSDTPPVNPTPNALWYDTVGGRLYVYFSDSWIDTNPESSSGAGSIATGDIPPTNPSQNELWYDTVGGNLYVYYSNNWVDTNPDTTPLTLRYCLNAPLSLVADVMYPQSLVGRGVRLNAHTRYEYKITGVVLKTSTNPVGLEYSLGGTAVISKHNFHALCTESSATNSIESPIFVSNHLTSGFNLPNTISTGLLTQAAYYNFSITGVIDTTTSGTVNPMISFTDLPGACSVLSGTRIELTTFGVPGANTIIGTWSI